LIATLRKAWDLGEPLTGRDATARTFEHVFTLDTARDPRTWPDFPARPVPEWTMDPDVLGRAVSGLGKGLVRGLVAHAEEIGVRLPPGVDDPDADLPPATAVRVLRDISLHYFPALTVGALPHDAQT
jgi:phospholipase C